MAAGFVLFVIGAGNDSPAAILGGLALMIIGLIVGIVRARVIHIAKIDETHIHLRLRPEAAQAFAAESAR